MKRVQRIVCFLLFAILITGLFVSMKESKAVNANTATIATPKLTLKSANSGTGIKIIMGKTKGAAGYEIYMTKRENDYSDYLSNNGEYDKLVATVQKNGKKKRTYIIKGLSKGTYSIKIRAYTTDGVYSEYSIEKSIKVKAAKAKENKEKTYDFSKVKIGDIITFGSYEQDGNMKNGDEEIEWIVLSKTKKDMLVISKYALDCLPYNKEDIDVTWEDCTLRKWLNDYFFATAFTKQEQDRIVTKKLKNDDNSEYETKGGNTTLDNVFLLSIDDMLETEYGFSSDNLTCDVSRRCAVTPYGKLQGVMTYDENYWGADWKEYPTTLGEPTCVWWLRSPGSNSNSGDIDYAASVGFDGFVSYFGCNVDVVDVAVRPALWLKL